jgi:hypothetical protein
MYIKCLTFLCVLLQLSALAQTGKITGSVKEKNGTTLKGANIKLLRENGSIAKYSVSDASGNFEADALKQGTYKMVFHMVGYDSLVSSLIHVAATPVTYDAVLTASSNELTSVAVTSRRSFVETKIDRTVIHPDAIISNAGANALEILDRSPGVLVDESGSISLKGKSVVVFIDDKPTYMTGTQLTEYLKSQSGSTIDRIELMSNPPAKYDAAGGAVINIKTKKSKIKGFNGNVNLSYTQGVYPRTNNSLNLNYRNNQWNVFGTFSQVLQNSFNDLDINRDYFTNAGSADYFFRQNSFIRNTSKAINTRVGADYYLSDHSTIGIVLTGNDRKFNGRTINTSYIIDEPYVIDSIIHADNNDKGKWNNRSANLNYRQDLKKNGANFSADVDYLVYTYDNDQYFKNKSFFSNGNAKHAFDLTGDLPAQIKIASFKADLTYPVIKNFNVDLGAKQSVIKTDNTALYNNIYNGVVSPDYDKTNRFLYDENISAGYISLSRDWKKVSLQTGLRGEFTESKGHQLGNAQKPDSSFRRTYFNLFPTVYLSFKLDSLDAHKLNLSYGKRIDRPVYQDLNPFISPLDQFTNYVGNPLLRPTFTDEVQLSYVYKNKLTATLAHYVVNDITQESIEIYGNNYFSRPANVGKADITALSLTFSQPLTKYWSLNAYTDAQRRHYKGMLYSGMLDTAALFHSFNITNQFTLGKGWSAELSGNYRSNILVGQIVSGEFWQMNAGVQKKLMKNKATIRLSVRDIFYTRLNWGYINNLRNATASYYNRLDSRVAAISFAYNFGKALQSRAKKAAGGAGQEEGRIRN